MSAMWFCHPISATAPGALVEKKGHKCLCFHIWTSAISKNKGHKAVMCFPHHCQILTANAQTAKSSLRQLSCIYQDIPSNFSTIWFLQISPNKRDSLLNPATRRGLVKKLSLGASRPTPWFSTCHWPDHCGLLLSISFSTVESKSISTFHPQVQRSSIRY